MQQLGVDILYKYITYVIQSVYFIHKLSYLHHYSQEAQEHRFTQAIIFFKNFLLPKMFTKHLLSTGHCIITNMYAGHSVMSESLQPHGLQPTRLLCPWDITGKNTRVDYHSLLQRIFPTQGLNRGLLHCRQILNCLRHQGSPISTKKRNKT